MRTREDKTTRRRAFGEWLRSQRIKRGYGSPRALAKDYLPLSESSLESYEIGRRLPRKDAVEGLGDFFGDPYGAMLAAGYLGVENAELEY